MKKFSFLCLIVMLFSLAANAQEVHVGKSKMVFVDLDSTSGTGTDSITIPKFPRNIAFSYYIINRGTTNLNGVVKSGMKANDKFLGTVDSTTDTIKGTFKPGDSIKVYGKCLVSDKNFKKGKNIVVVWPTGTLFHLAGDSMRGKIRILGSAGIFSINAPLNSDLSVYPQPAISDLHIRCDRQGVSIRSIRVFDITGRQVFREQSESINMIHAEAWRAGAYIIEASLSNGDVQRIQVCKSR